MAHGARFVFLLSASNSAETIGRAWRSPEKKKEKTGQKKRGQVRF
jgi:hypothetical protein